MGLGRDYLRSRFNPFSAEFNARRSRILLEKQARAARGAAWETGPWPRIIAGLFVFIAIALIPVLFWVSDTEGRISEVVGIALAILVCVVIGRKVRARTNRGS